MAASISRSRASSESVGGRPDQPGVARTGLGAELARIDGVEKQPKPVVGVALLRGDLGRVPDGDVQVVLRCVEAVGDEIGYRPAHQRQRGLG